MKVLISHPTGNANVRAIVNSLYKFEYLYRFHTSVAVFHENIWDKLSKIAGISDFKKRRYDDRLQEFTHQYPWMELGAAAAKKMRLERLIQHEKGLFCVDNIYSVLDKHVSASLEKGMKDGLTAVYAYEDGALETFKEAKKLGLKCIYDLPIAYWETGRKLLFEEAERMPEWSSTMGRALKDSEAKLARKQEEMQLADAIVGPGSFVMDSIPQWAAEKKKITSPFGSPAASGFQPKMIQPNKPLRVLFAGSMGQRKGLGDLFQAIKLLDTKHIELVVLGSLLAPYSFYEKQLQGFTYEGTKPHAEVLELMKSCDIFCLPSIVEGRALVMQEAMTQGLPIIITPNTGGADLVEEGKTGFLVPIRSPEAIAEKIEWFIKNREQIPYMSECAYKKASEYTWDNYGKKVVNSITHLD